MTPRAATAGGLGPCAPPEILHAHSPGPPVIRVEIRRSTLSVSRFHTIPSGQ